jgi:hypothetical protein
MPARPRLTNEEIAGVLGAPVADVAANRPLVDRALAERGLTGLANAIAAYATIGVEVVNGFRPIEELGDRETFRRLYEARTDLGNVRRGDGAKYHGRGYVPLLGRLAYRTYGASLGVPLEQRPRLALEPEVAARLLSAIFADRGVPAAAAAEDWEAVRRRVAGDLDGWPRFERLVRALEKAAGTGQPARRALRTLTLTSPFARGADVERAQRALGVPDDGEYGPVTASAVAEWKRSSGYPDRELDNVLRPVDMRRLLGREPLPPGFARRAKRRAAQAAQGGSGVGARAAAEMETWARAGFRERPTGSNRVPQLVKLGRRLGVADDYALMGLPWCGYAAFLAGLAVGGASARAGLIERQFNPRLCTDILAQAEAGKFGLRVVPLAEVARGDLVLVDNSGPDRVDHVGRLLERPTNGRLLTVDGNSGDRVATTTRDLSSIRAFVRDS